MHQLPQGRNVSSAFFVPCHNYNQICDLLLSSARSRSTSKGLQLHGYIVKSGLSLIPLVANNLINFYSKSQLPLESRRAFEDTPRKSATTWSSIISCFAQNELPWMSLEFLRRMMAGNLRPDDHVLPSATKSCGILNRCDIGRSVHCLSMKTGYDADVFVGSSLVDMYAKCGDIVDARNVFDEMPQRNVVTWSGMMYGYAQMGENEEALWLFKEALFENLAVNDYSFSSVISVCANSTLLELGRQIQGLCVKSSFDSSSFVGSSLVSLYSKCGVLEGAYRVFDETPLKNLGIWNAMLKACAQHSDAKRVIELFKRMKREGMKPNFITFLNVLNACSHAGLVDEGRYYFDLMIDSRIEPTDKHYASLVDMLGRAGKLQEALEVIKNMPIDPTESVWGALLTGCTIHKNTELAAFAADKVFELGPVSSGMHISLSNAYAADGRFEDAAKARKLLRDRGEKKETGLSWVEERNKVHTFAAGDRRHERSKEIYEKLAELGEEIEKAGYVADTSFVLREVDGDEKNQTIRYHSERLAIAFALITFSGDRPIRVIKNLRVCGDCHNAIKFMSVCTGRVIIVRDNKRFHRFEDGKCSCNDYW
ncbi:putative pentatricopeptide repeat-containing protein At5g52630 [Eutrema salsugineum]|uniref:putative pentatricopeptide repeat-containing protein At5g52630 n=1 Tax=Eutrema salsugineum TaxID=72664 RepID=UPI000CED1B6D|nr:putative pentatricopeptide repeat-containing protein At5g52630 [Eutrema salsugineum]